MSSPSRVNTLALVSLLLGAASIGFAPIFPLFSDVGPIAIAAWRMLLATPFLFWLWRRSPGEGEQKVSLMIVLAALCFAGDLSLWHASLRLTSVAHATLIGAVGPLLMTLIAWLWLNEPLQWRTYGVGLLLAVIGMLMLLWPHIVAPSPDMPHAGWGDFIAFVSACMYTGYLLALKMALRKHSTLWVMWTNTLIGGVMLLALSLGVEPNWLPGSLVLWWPLLALALVCQIIGQTLIASAMQRLTAGFSAIGLFVQPLVAAIAAWLLFNQTLTTGQLLGGVLILGGILQARRGS
ncbi:DMT family transporter [Leeia oryzae]|uniref:DMT family transporter n=1 Tax=Leeia oryzae TaxID=356662 RepID=UPI00036AF46F|nr:DMT family transporter [Leeia oryzae]